jgi:protein-glucosylgalactosylhydroxylysine glucosidase
LNFAKDCGFLVAMKWFVLVSLIGIAAIDRQALVARHNVVLTKLDPENPLQVGNGEFAFTADATGLQTFPDLFTNTIPLGTLSQWGWHTIPNTNGWSMEKYHYKEFDVFGRKVGYADVPKPATPESNWLRSNPHRLHLGQIGFVFDGKPISTNAISDVEQTLDLWNGVLHSRFKLEGVPVEVETVCHPTRDVLAVRMKSSLLTRRLNVQLRFPYGTGEVKTADWSKPDAHVSKLTGNTIARKLDNDAYFVTSGAKLAVVAKHTFTITPTNEFVVAFSAQPVGDLPNFAQTLDAAGQHWKKFWSTGGAIDLSGSKDPRWRELERRIVLSQYLTTIQCAGSLPPQETGLAYNSWYGKFHLEMHWWHAAHFALWDRLPLLEKSLVYYPRILPVAEANAKRQGYTGARWPKMTDASGADSPSPIAPFLIWQEPHPIFYAELCYRDNPRVLNQFTNVVFETAVFMASYPVWVTNRYVLGPVLQCAQEIFPKDHTLNPTFELTYWRWGLETAQKWRERAGLPREKKWDNILQHLAKPPIEDDRYLFAETAKGTYSQKKWIDDHPSVLGAYGMLPGPDIDRDTMKRTLDWIWYNWNWPDTWGWDYPMVAMSAARLGNPERAVDALLRETPKNHYRLNGHNHQRHGLTVYLPGNGGLLYAVAMMAAGWDSAPKGNAPGFPTNGQWVVQYEGLKPAP